MIRTRRTISASAVFLASLLAANESGPLLAQSGDSQYHPPRLVHNVAELVALAAQEPAPAQAPDTSELTIAVLEGENGVNIVKKKTAVKPVVEVRDRNKLPVAGATVTFTLPSEGAGGTFLNGSKILTVITDSSGKAAVSGMHPLGTGAFKITVSAAIHAHTAAAVIAQTNYLTVAAATSAGVPASSLPATGGALSSAAVGGIVAGVAAVAVGVVAAKVATGSKPSGTIGLGSGPSFGH